MINLIGSLNLKSWWHSSLNHVECSKLKHYTNISVFKSIYFALFHSYLTYSILPWVRTNKKTLLPSIRLQNEAVRTLEYNKTKTTVLYSKHKILEIPDLFQLSVAKFMYPFIMVDYLITLITTMLRLHQSTNIKQDLLLCKNIIYPEWKHIWVSFL